MNFINQTKKKVVLFLVFAFLFSSSVSAHNGNWFQSNNPGTNRFDYFIPALFGWSLFTNPLYRPNNSQQFSPFHVSRDNTDNTGVHITFGTDSREGNNSQFPRYAYFPNWTSDSNRWRILGQLESTSYNAQYRSEFMTYDQFQTQLRSDITRYQNLRISDSTHAVYYDALIDDARAAIGDPSGYGAGGNSILADWWNDYSQLPSSSSGGTPPSPTAGHDEL